MRILIVGGGPAGLLFALLMKRRDPRHAIRVLEQNPAENTYGWGVVFSGKALSFLKAEVPDVFTELSASLEVWDDLTIVHQDESMVVDGSSFSGIARLQLLNVLHNACRRAGVDLRFNEQWDGTSGERADLIVGADGVNSRVRELYAGEFGTHCTELTNRFIWYGTEQVFDTLSLIFRKTAVGCFVAHTYRYSPTRSTFLVECDEKTFHNSGLDTMDDPASRKLCERIFAQDLAGHGLLSNHSVWRRFPVIKNTHWFAANVVLLGDALRTVHFSIGSGTRTAMEDAISLSQAFAGGSDVQNALERFVAVRKPPADKLLQVAGASMGWYEDFARSMDQPPWQFALSYMTRGGRVDLDALAERSPRFVSGYRAWRDNLP